MGVRIYCQQVTQVLTVLLVGKIVPEPEPSTNISYDPLGVTQPTLSSTPSKTEHGATNEMGSSEPQSPSRLNWPQQNVLPGTQEGSIVVNPSVRERMSYHIAVSTLPPCL